VRRHGFSFLCANLVFQDGFYEGELMNGKQGLVPSNFIEKVPGKVSRHTSRQHAFVC